MPHSTSRLFWWLPATLLLFGTIGVGCGENGEGSGGDDCVSTEQFFFEEVWTPTLSTTCYACHNAQGQASASSFVLWSASQTGFEAHNLAEFSEMARTTLDGEPLVLLKPTAQVPHEGTQLFEVGSEQYEAFARMVDQVSSPVACGDGPSNEEEVIAGSVVMLDELATIRRATLTLTGRLPTEDEMMTVGQNGEAGIRQVLDDVTREEAFYEWLMESYNDLFLTDRYLGGDNATNLLDDEDFPQRRWYDEQWDRESERGQERYNYARARTNYAVAREPLELISHVVRNDRPFTEILTADYRLVNDFSAIAYGVDSFGGGGPEDLDEAWREEQIADQPMAGVLTSPMWLNRFPTTPTNRNRHRSRMVWDFFLATDVMRLAERPVDPTSIEANNPTMFNADCAVCHAQIDPIAGAFQNWTAEGRYIQPGQEGSDIQDSSFWYGDMRRPGLSEDDVVPDPETNRSLQWLADRIAGDDRFALATVQTMYRALSGRDALRAPTDTENPRFGDMQVEYNLQRDAFDGIAESFIESGFDLRVVITELILSRYFRGDNWDDSLGDASHLQDLGQARLLTPEALDRKIEAVLGLPWSRDVNSTHYLLGMNDYRIFYGGIDSDNVISRITDPNGVMVNIQWRLANEMACRSVSYDFTRDVDDRLLMPYVEVGYTPEDDNGFTISAAVDAIRFNIQHLYERVLGEDIAIDDPEIDRAYQLFYDTWVEGVEGMSVEDEEVRLSTSLPGSCRATRDFFTGEDFPEERQISRDDDYTIRAWMAVVTYLLADYRFLHE